MKVIIDNRVQVFVLKLTGTEDENSVNQLLDMLPSHSQERFFAYTNLRSKLQSVLGEVLARYAIGNFGGIPYTTAKMLTGKNGKPYFSHPQNIHYNISHSGLYIVCAVSNSEIGIDVERIRKVNLRIAERYFSPTELSDLLAMSESSRMEYFITLWTIKEAYLKSTGTGLTQKLNSFTINKLNDRFQLSGNLKAQNQDVISLKLDAEYYLAVCSAKNLVLEPVCFLNPTKLIIR